MKDFNDTTVLDPVQNVTDDPAQEKVVNEQYFILPDDYVFTQPNATEKILDN
jgi:hypothetical protein